jgi:hypothetical protein
MIRGSQPALPHGRASDRIIRRFSFRSQVWKQDHIADRMLVRQQHYQPIDTDANARGRRHPIGESPDVIFVHDHRFFVAPLTLLHLILETLVLLFRII